MIPIKTEEQIKGIKEASKILKKVFKEVERRIRPGLKLKDLDSFIHDLIVSFGARPAFLGYRGFPASSCLSLNNEVVHGIPNGRILKPGDLLKVDIGVEYKGFFSDMAKTYSIGVSPKEIKRLLIVTEKALEEGIKVAREGNHLSDISHAIEKVVSKAGFSVVKELGGHGIGLALHEEPIIPNYGPPGRGPILKEGMVFAIEPMVNMGSSAVKVKKDGWTILTLDGSISAHFEHTIVVRKDGAEILTDEEKNG
jgi:methionyl aminopeptidase